MSTPTMNAGAVKCVDGWDHCQHERLEVRWCCVCDDDPFEPTFEPADRVTNEHDDGNYPPIPHVIAAGSGDDRPARVTYEPDQ